MNDQPDPLAVAVGHLLVGCAVAAFFVALGIARTDIGKAVAFLAGVYAHHQADVPVARMLARYGI